MYNYNIFHKQNTKIQKKIIKKSNYVYQSLIKLSGKYFLKKGTVLDLGCGVGTIDFYFAQHGFFVTGIDISSKAIELANESRKELNLKNIEFKCLKLEDLDLSKKYDYIICSEVIEHIENEKNLLKQIYDLLEENGIALISTPLKSAPLYRWGYLYNFDKKVGHLRRYSKDLLTRLILEMQFNIIETFQTEGLLRNFIFTSDRFGVLVKFAKWPISLLFNLIDYVLIVLFGPSNIYLVLQKK